MYQTYLQYKIEFILILLYSFNNMIIFINQYYTQFTYKHVKLCITLIYECTNIIE